MHNAETVSRAIQVENLDVCHWRAGCGESRTSGSEGGRRKSAPGNRGNSPAAYPTTDPEGQGGRQDRQRQRGGGDGRSMARASGR